MDPIGSSAGALGGKAPPRPPTFRMSEGTEGVDTIDWLLLRVSLVQPCRPCLHAPAAPPLPSPPPQGIPLASKVHRIGRGGRLLGAFRLSPLRVLAETHRQPLGAGAALTPASLARRQNKVGYLVRYFNYRFALDIGII